MSKFSENGVNFNVVGAGMYTGGVKISRFPYPKNSNNEIIHPQPVINAIDIDWNNAEVPGISGKISSTSQLLKIIGQLNSGNQGGGGSGSGTGGGSIDPSLLDNYATVESVQELVRELNARIDEYHVEYSFSYNLTNLTKNSNNETTMKKNDIVVLNIQANTGYLLPNTVSVVGATFEYDSSNGNITIYDPIQSTIVINASTNSKRTCTFSAGTLQNLSMQITYNQKPTYTIGEAFRCKLTVTEDNELYGIPNNVTGTNCTISNYNNNTGEFTVTCNGNGNMIVSATAKDIANYKFAVALETNPIFTVSGGTITAMNVANLGSLDGVLSATGQCPVNFANGFTAPNSVIMEGAYVWMIIPSKYFNTSNFNFINGTNKYLFKQSNIQNLTVDTKIKECVSITTGKIAYTLICVSNNGLGGKQEFMKI